MKKRIASVLLLFCLVTAFFPVHAMAAGVGGVGVTLRLNRLKNRFPEGKYWNHLVTTDYNNGDQIWGAWYTNREFAESFADSVTDYPCYTHNGTAPVGTYDCNCFDGAIQCWGYAAKIFYEVFGERLTSLEKRWDTWNIRPGDYVRFSYEHSAIVLFRDGDTITTTDCNYGYTDQIRWSGTESVSRVSYFKHASNYDSVDASIPYYIHSKLDWNKVVDVNEDRNDNGTKIQLWSWNGCGAQQFELIPHGYIGSHYYYSIVKKGTFQCLDVSGGVAASEVNVQLYHWNGTAAQQWCFIPAGDGYYYLQNRLGYYMDACGASNADGTQIWTYSFNGTDAQKWALDYAF